MFTWPLGMLAFLVWTRRSTGIFLYFIYGRMFLFVVVLGLGLAGALRR